MNKRGRNQHEWEFQPELGIYFNYCQLCGKAECLKAGEFYGQRFTWKQAIAFLHAHPDYFHPDSVGNGNYHYGNNQ